MSLEYSRKEHQIISELLPKFDTVPLINEKKVSGYFIKESLVFSLLYIDRMLKFGYRISPRLLDVDLNKIKVYVTKNQYGQYQWKV